MKLFSFSPMSYKFKHPRGRISRKPETENTIGWDIYKSALEGRMFIPICKIPPQKVDEENSNTTPKVDYYTEFEGKGEHTSWVVTYQCPSCNHTVHHKGTVLNIPGIDMVPYCVMLLEKYIQDINTQMCSLCVGCNKLDLDGMILDGSFHLVEGHGGLHLTPKVRTESTNTTQSGLFYFKANAWSPEQGVLVDNNRKCTAEELAQYCKVRMMSNVIDPGFGYEVQKNKPNSSDIRNWLVELKPNLTLTFTIGSGTVRCSWDGLTVKSSVNHKFG